MGKWLAFAPRTVQPAQSIQFNPIQPNPTHFILYQTPIRVPSFVQRCAPFVLASDLLFPLLLPASSPRYVFLHSIVAPGSLEAGTCGQPPPLAPPLPYPSPVTLIAQSIKRTTSPGSLLRYRIRLTLTYSMLTFLSKHLYLPCLFLLSCRWGPFFPDHLPPGRVGRLQ